MPKSIKYILGMVVVMSLAPFASPSYRRAFKRGWNTEIDHKRLFMPDHPVAELPKFKNV